MNSCVPTVASGKAECRPPLTPPNSGGETRGDRAVASYLNLMTRNL